MRGRTVSWWPREGPPTSGAELLFGEALFFPLFPLPLFPFFQLFLILYMNPTVLNSAMWCIVPPQGSPHSAVWNPSFRLWSLHLCADSFLTHTMDPHPLDRREGKCWKNRPQSYQPPSSSCPKDPTASSFHIRPLKLNLLTSAFPTYL